MSSGPAKNPYSIYIRAAQPSQPLSSQQKKNNKVVSKKPALHHNFLPFRPPEVKKRKQRIARDPVDQRQSTDQQPASYVPCSKKKVAK